MKMTDYSILEDDIAILGLSGRSNSNCMYKLMGINPLNYILLKDVFSKYLLKLSNIHYLQFRERIHL